jgi:hypothetical protein
MRGWGFSPHDASRRRALGGLGHVDADQKADRRSQEEPNEEADEHQVL